MAAERKWPELQSMIDKAKNGIIDDTPGAESLLDMERLPSAGEPNPALVKALEAEAATTDGSSRRAPRKSWRVA